MQETWRDIKEYEGLYQVSNLGKIKSLNKYWKVNNYNNIINKKEKIIKQNLDHKNYLFVHLWKNGKSKNFKVHRLVAQTFIPNPENKLTVNHKDGNKSNNSVENLEWCTQSENVIHAYKKGLAKRRTGKMNKNSKIVYQIDKETKKIINIFYGTTEASRITGIPQSNIWRCCAGKQKYSNNYIWKYK